MYRAIFKQLEIDIQSKTGIITQFKIDNQDISGDTPTLLLNYKGTVNVTASPSKVILSQEILFSIEMRATAATPANIAQISKAEGKIASIFPISLDVKAAGSKWYPLAGADGYNASYRTQWSIPASEMRADSYQRKWDLILTIHRRQN